MILITKCYQKINLSPRLRAEDQFLFFHLTRLKKKKKKQDLSFVLPY